MDVVSDLLAVVKLRGAFYFNGEFSAPWSVRTPPSTVLAPFLGQQGRVIIFHLLTDGRGVAGPEHGELIPISAGDIIVFPHGDAHVVASDASTKPVDYEGALHQIMAQGLRLTRAGGGGDIARFVCGYLSCDARMAQMLFGSLPAVFKVSVRGEGAGQWLENAIRFSVSEAHTAPAGGEAVLERLAEALFIETLRRYLLALPETQTGWLAGVRDRFVGKALGLLHGNPGTAWSLDQLAQEVGLSRSALNDRFRHFLGETPKAYLTRWRLQLGARRLQTSKLCVAEVAAEVGYDSEQAFNRAFCREFGMPPGRYRKQAKPT